MLDFIQFINDNVNLTTAKKLALLDSFVEQYGYQEEDEEGNPNPVSKKDFANKKISQYVVESVNAIRKKNAESEIKFEELVLEEV